jgi:16S rRNA A1518/A1519 N6-dimethyltransferase RsmA/KsgA/DIM1 with predicted DNA glycosylase/AP lyase activity
LTSPITSLPRTSRTTSHLPLSATCSKAISKPRRVVLTIQKEVAERICAKPGDLSLLALSVQVYGKPSIAAKIPAGAFHPAPKVDSAILRIDIYDEPLVPNRFTQTPSSNLPKQAFRAKKKDPAQFALLLDCISQPQKQKHFAHLGRYRLQCAVQKLCPLKNGNYYARKDKIETKCCIFIG